MVVIIGNLACLTGEFSTLLQRSLSSRSPYYLSSSILCLSHRLHILPQIYRMRGEGLSRDCPQPMRCSGKKNKSRPGKMKGNIDNVVVIDIDDSDGYDGVFIIDVPKRSKKGVDVCESLKPKFGPSHVLREGNRVSFEGTIHIDDDDEDEVKDGSFKSRNPYGYHFEFESDSSEDDQNLGSNGMPSSSAPSKVNNSTVDASDDCEFVGVKTQTHRFSRCRARYAEESYSRNRYGYHPESSDSYESDSSDCEILDSSRGNPRAQWEEACKRKKKSHAVKDQSGSSNGSKDQLGAQDRDGSSNYCTHTRQNGRPGSSSGYNPETTNFSETEAVQSSNSGPAVETTQKVNQQSVPSCSNSTSGANPSPLEKAADCFRSETIVEDHSSGLEKCQNSNQDNSRFHTKDPSSSKDGVWQNLVKSTFVPKSKENRRRDNTASSKGKEELDSSEKHAGRVSHSDHHRETQDEPETSGSGESKRPSAELIPETQRSGDNNPSSSSPTADASLCPGNIITEREKMKETDEYKRAIEEEWEARQQQLRIQAEEAQRLRKRKKAEALRISDMQRRQKQRLEEVRETQKKDEEDLNTKERFRVEIRKQLSQLESRCIDLASLLRSLGINVGGGIRPTPNEVHAAYKRAVLKFHPDRASRTDIRQQVESEEKFKLICRMKEKVFPASLC
ncbi:hypothetical protein LINPERHAP1_LOCUS20452 [Linum perenne]